MNQDEPHVKKSHSRTRTIIFAITEVWVAFIFGVGSCTLITHYVPSDKFLWSGLALMIIWLLLEMFFEIVVGNPGIYSKRIRWASTIALISGFFIAWFFYAFSLS